MDQHRIYVLDDAKLSHAAEGQILAQDKGEEGANERKGGECVVWEKGFGQLTREMAGGGERGDLLVWDPGRRKKI